MKMHSKMSSGKRRPFCPGGGELIVHCSNSKIDLNKSCGISERAILLTVVYHTALNWPRCYLTICNVLLTERKYFYTLVGTKLITWNANRCEFQKGINLGTRYSSLSPALSAQPGAHCIKVFPIVSQIRWKFGFIVTALHTVISLRRLHRPRQHSCRGVQTLVLINLLPLGCEQNEILIECKLWWRIR